MTELDTTLLACAAGVIPVVPALELDRVNRSGEALKAAGLPIAEVTLRSATTLQMLKRLSADRSSSSVPGRSSGLTKSNSRLMQERASSSRPGSASA